MIIPVGRRMPQVGDLICIYEGPMRSNVVKLEIGGVYQCRYGVFPHEDFLAQPFGTKVFGRRKKEGEKTKSFVYFVKIIYTADIAAIVSRLELRPGSVVIEAGTGSGSLSHSLARAVYPDGKLYTFEYHAERQKKAQAEFERHCLQSVVVSAHRDVCEEGFGVSGTDALFLDVPSPWLAIEHARSSLRDGGMFASYSPCIEQVQETAECLRKNGAPISLKESVNASDNTEQLSKKRKLVEAVPEADQRGHTAYLTFARLVL